MKTGDRRMATGEKSEPYTGINGKGKDKIAKFESLETAGVEGA